MARRQPAEVFDSNHNAAVEDSGPTKDGQSAPMKYLALQPILDKEGAVYGYELLFRCDAHRTSCSGGSERISESVLDSTLLAGLDELCGGHKAFVNCTRDVLTSRHVTLLPPERTIIEVLETVAPDAEVIGACACLKSQGYRIALDDFVFSDAHVPLLALADIIKIDWQAPTPLSQATRARAHAPAPCRLLAEKVQTREESIAAQKAGFSLFQGFYFCRPETVAVADVPQSKLNLMRLMAAIHQRELDFREVERIIRAEPSLYYRLLRYLNSPLFGLRNEIRSIKSALTLLGEEQFRRWATLLIAVCAGDGKPHELVRTALARARFRELLAPRYSVDADLLFLTGLLSLMDAMLDVPMQTLLQRIPVPDGVRSALIGGLGKIAQLHRMALAWEQGNWGGVTPCLPAQPTPEMMVAAYYQAQTWAQTVTRL